MTGQTTKLYIAEYKYIEWKGQKHVLELQKVLNKDIFKKVDELKARDKEVRANFSLLKKIDEPQKVDKDNSDFAKSKKIEKVANALSRFAGQ